MAEQIKYVSLDNLTKYDGKIKEHIETKDAALKTNLEGQVTVVANALDSEITRAKAAEATNAAAAQAAQAAADTAQSEVDALELLVGTLPTGTDATTVVDYVNKKTAGIATDAALGELQNQLNGVQGDVATIKGDYLKASDKTELSDAITAEQNRATGIEGGLRTDVDAIKADYLKGADKTALQGAIDGVAEDVATISGDYLKGADKTELEGKINGKVAQTDYDAKMEEIDGDIDGLQTQINTIMNNPDAEGAINSINEFTQYVADHGTIADGFRADIDKNKGDIAAEVKRAGEAESALSGRLDTLEAIDHDAYAAADTALKNELTTEIGKKADASVVSDMDAAYKAADEGLSGRIATLEGKFTEGEGSVDGMISDAIDTEAARVDGELDKKVDKVDGYGLSKNDLSDALKANYDAAYTHSQEAHAPANAQANVIESVKVNGSALTITGKAVDISVPTDNAQLANGAGYLVAGDIANKADKATTLAGYGIADAYTSAQTDTAIENAMSQLQPCTDAEINALFA